MKFGFFLSTAVVASFAALGTAEAASLSYDIDPAVVIPVGYAGFGDLNVDGLNDVMGAVNADGTVAVLSGVQDSTLHPGTSGLASVSFVLTDDNGFAIDVGYDAEIGENAQADYNGYWSSMADGTSGTNGTSAVLYDLTGSSPAGALAEDDGHGFFAVRTDLYTQYRNAAGELSYDFSGRIYSWVEIFAGPELTATRGGFSTDFANSESAYTPENPSPVPLPAGMPLMALALGGLAVTRRITRR